MAVSVGAAEFEPLSTTGVPLATRQDWRELLAAAAKLGTTTVWTAFHGLGVEHDRQVNRAGAWAETCLAVQRVHAAGLRAGCNVFLTKASAPQAERLLDALQRLEIDGMWWGPATYYPTARARRNEHLRPELSDLRPIATRIRQRSLFDHDVWANLEDSTEAAWTRRALAGDWPTWRRHDGQVLELVCRPNLDLHTGVAGWYRERHGNLRTDGPHAVLSRALEQGGRTSDALWFGPDPPPSVAELAARHGDRGGQGLHFSLGPLPVAGPGAARATHRHRQLPAADTVARVSAGRGSRDRDRLGLDQALPAPALTTPSSCPSSTGSPAPYRR